MAPLDPSSGRRSESPTSSGRASPISRKWTTDETPSKDKAYRRYASGVERSLSLFDTALQEWADYISFLGRLLKSLQAHPATTLAVPSKAIVAKRLAQCLNPSLPSGVHQKALEVYAYIFSMIGKDALSRDLPLYLPGLASTLSFASLSVRGPFLDLLEKYLLKLEARSLRPALKSIILSVLPGLEEETSEEFEWTLKLLDGFKNAVSPTSGEDLGQNHDGADEYFWQCFFLAAITSNTRRLGALAYMVRNLPKLGEPPVGSAKPPANGSKKLELKSDAGRLAGLVTSPEPGLLLRCFAAGLADEQLLIQRGFLDLLVTHLPLHSPVLKHRVKTEDLELLITAAVGVVARREMSLNRRLWTWLLGPEPVNTDSEGGPESPGSVSADPLTAQSSSRTRYFEEYGMQPLTRALLKMINRDTTNPTERARPFRICLSLMDRWEIGGLVVPDIFLPVVSSVRKFKEQAASKAEFSEVLRSASVFFDGVESGLIWGEIVGLIAQAIGPGKLIAAERVDKLALVNFIISHFNVREEEMLVIHAPLTTLTVLTLLKDIKERSVRQGGNSNEVSRLALSTALDLVDLIPERAFQRRPSTSQSSATAHTEGSVSQKPSAEILRIIKIFYVEDQGNLDAVPPPFSFRDVGELLIREIGIITSQTLLEKVSSADAGLKSKLLVLILNKVPKTESLNLKSLLSAMQERMATQSQLPFATFTSIVSLATNLFSTGYMPVEDLSELIEPLVRIAWSYLSASQPKYHVETVRCLWQLQTSLSLANRDIESTISSLMLENDVRGTFIVRDANPGRSFSVLWTHTLQDHAGHKERGATKSSSGEIQTLARMSGTGNYEVMLSRPLFLFLDALLDERTQLFMTVRSWLQNMVGLDKLFYAFVAKFAAFNCLQTASPDVPRYFDGDSRLYTPEDDLDQCLYYLQTLSNVLQWSTDSTWTTLAENTIAPDAGDHFLLRIAGRDSDITLLEFFLHVCLRAVAGKPNPEHPELDPRISQLHQIALTTLHQILLSPFSAHLAELQLEDDLIDRLIQSLDGPDPFIQVLLLDVVFDALKIRSIAETITTPLKTVNNQEPSQNPRRSLSEDPADSRPHTKVPPPPQSLIKALQAGLASPSGRPVLDSWVNFLTECLPLYSENIFQILIPLVEILCAQVGETFRSLQTTFKTPDADADVSGTAAPESTLISLLNGLEQVLARGHDKLLRDESRVLVVKSPDQPQGFFGNMVSNVFTTEAPQSRSATANNRLTVLLSFQDAVRICFLIWSWGGTGDYQDGDSAASFNYTSLRMRNRARRLLEHLFAAEALECLETVVEVWQKSPETDVGSKPTIVFNLLHVLDGSRPKHTIPAIFNAIYSRTNPGALEPARKSTMTSSLSDIDLVTFLVEYARSLEDDAMDEIWTDCMTFLKDLLTNPFPHRQTLLSLLEFAAILGEKVDNTNFGEQRKMRRELADIFLRLLTAMFTTRPMGFSDSAFEGDEKSSATTRPLARSDDVVGILASIAPNLPKVLVEPDRVLAASNTISTSVIGPTFKSKAFPDNVSKSTLVLLYQLSRLPNNQKAWKKDLGDAFVDPKFFSSPVSLIQSDWLPLLKQWTLSDKERLPEILSRIVPPATAGIVFGVGATSARLEADRKTQLNLRRAATLILATVEDNFVADLPLLQEKIVELLPATTTSSPSSTTRADIYLLLRAIVLKTSAIHLATLWPIINAELHTAISSIIAPDHSVASDTYNNTSILQACKLLDMLICIAPDDFQLHEWLFITDTIDAVYRPSHFHPTALADEMSEELGSAASHSALQTESSAMQASRSQTRRPLIGPGGISDEGNLERKDELVAKVLRPFFGQLSIFAFESMYSMGGADWEGCLDGVLKDLFDETSIVKAL
ncbi:Dopey, N-terminal-domain-containing protein [Amylocarpus encephaloides]|uniref:Dopey, N-terminal-domain-containing protein n=1 Tax=Amylocarpus encephaloides TaxID=45428 RepID=A0A9P7YHM1_9HELO|nr:Dopey, N-terminal-domain-containing protein [Amylocarpus encephaloides]